MAGSRVTSACDSTVTATISPCEAQLPGGGAFENDEGTSAVDPRNLHGEQLAWATVVRQWKAYYESASVRPRSFLSTTSWDPHSVPDM